MSKIHKIHIPTFVRKTVFATTFALAMPIFVVGNTKEGTIKTQSDTFEAIDSKYHQVAKHRSIYEKTLNFLTNNPGVSSLIMCLSAIGFFNINPINDFKNMAETNDDNDNHIDTNV